MKVMTIGDTHIWTYPKFGLDPSGYPRRLKEIDNGLNQILGMVITLKIDMVVFLGDVFEHRDHVDTLSLCVFLKFINNLPDHVEVLILKGNHDSFSKFDDKSWIVDFPRIRPILNTQAYSVKLFHCRGLNVFGIPYSDDVNQVKDNIDTICSLIKDDGSKYLTVAHIGVAEIASLNGYNDNKAFPQKELERIPGYVRIGHYHDRAELTDRMMYVGTPWQTTFGEINQIRGVDVYDTEEDRWNFYQVDIPPLITCSVEDFDRLKALHPDAHFRIEGSPDEISDDRIVSFKLALVNEQDISVDGDRNDIQITEDYINEIIGLDDTIRRGMIVKAREIIEG